MANATIVTLPQMVDLALNSPEVGIVNFTVLHSLLHVIVKQLDLVDTNVEFRGSDSERLQSYIANAKPGPLLTLTEYTVGEEGGKDEKKKLKKGIQGTVEKGKADEQQTEKPPQQSDSQNKVIVVESSKDISAGPTVVITKNHFDKLEFEVKKISRKVKELSELPANTALIEVLRGENPEKTPVLDMFQILSLTKRLDAAEVSMQKIASLMEDIAKKGLDIPLDDADIFGTGEESGKPTHEQRIEKLENVVFKSGSKHMVAEGEVEGEEYEGFESPENLESQEEHMGQEVHGGREQNVGHEEHMGQEESGGQEDREGGQEFGRPTVQSQVTHHHGSGTIPEGLTEDLDILKKTVETLTTDLDEIKKLLSGDGETENLPPELRLTNLEGKFNDFQEQLGSLDNMFCRQVEMLQKRIVDLEKDVGEIVEKLNLGDVENSQPEGQTLGDLFNKLLQLQDEMTALSDTSQKLLEDREEKQHTLDVMLEQIELLKTVKADREDLEDALADKADACMVNRKVSVEQFDAACEDLTRAIEDSLTKLAQQEEMWTQALDEIQKEMGNKMDRVELTPLRDYINKKLKGLQDKLKSLAALKRENEAAGTKSRLLKNVNCISCDKDVVMRKEMDPSLFPKSHSLPPARSMAPYLAYELDQLRKQQKQVPPKKDLVMLENAMKISAKTCKIPDHICNRYCGGSHTVTTPTQRVTRLGHFLEQWGPEVGTAQDSMIRGTDGHMYRGKEESIMEGRASVRPSQAIRPSQASQFRPSQPGRTPSQSLQAIPSSGAEEEATPRPSVQIRKKSSVKPRESKVEPEHKPDTPSELEGMEGGEGDETTEGYEGFEGMEGPVPGEGGEIAEMVEPPEGVEGGEEGEGEPEPRRKSTKGTLDAKRRSRASQDKRRSSMKIDAARKRSSMKTRGSESKPADIPEATPEVAEPLPEAPPAAEAEPEPAPEA